MIFFTSDTHFWHHNIIEYCQRSIIDGWQGAPGWMDRNEATELMNDTLIRKWNERIGFADEVYHLGDFAFCGKEKLRAIVQRLHGIKHLIRGNHDSHSEEFWKELGFQWVRHYFELRVHDVHQSEEDKTKFVQYHQPIVLSHYPILSWNGMAHGTWHLHGHCHGSIDQTWNKTGLRMDVGVDTNNLYPWSYDEVKIKMALRTVVPVDHHAQ